MLKWACFFSFSKNDGFWAYFGGLGVQNGGKMAQNGIYGPGPVRLGIYRTGVVQIYGKNKSFWGLSGLAGQMGSTGGQNGQKW